MDRIETVVRPAIRFDDVSVRFGGNTVVDRVSIDVRPGKVHAIVGQNGAGKSTLMKALVGVNPLASGTIVVDGEPAQIAGPDDARRRGVEIVYQDQSLADELSVLENMILGRETTRFWGMLHARVMRAEATASLERMGVAVDLDALVSELTASQRVQMSVAAAMLSRPKVLILDEPTAALSSPEADGVLSAIRRATAAGVAVLYISHRLGEITRVADDISILRDGKLIYSGELGTMTTPQMISQMVGQEVGELYPRVARELGEVRISVHDLHAPPLVHGVTFRAREGEIVGLAGLVGSGAKEILHSIYGVNRVTAGSVQTDGRKRSTTPYVSVRRGYGFVPEERRLDAVFPALEVRKNMTAAVVGRRERWGVLNERKERAEVARAIGDLGVMPSDSDAAMKNLSGGNQQKAIIGRWMLADSECLLVDEPTAGVDVAAKAKIYEELGRVAATGKTVIMASSDFEELLGVSDRVLVVRDGAIVDEVLPGEVTVEALTALAATPSTDHERSREKHNAEVSTAIARLFERTRRFVIPAVMVAVLLALGLGAPTLVSVESGLDIVRQAGAPALLAAALAVALGVGAFDVSIGAVALAASTASAIVVSATGSTILGVIAGVSIGIVAGCVNGVLVSVLKVAGFVATLGTMFLLVGVTLGLNGGLPIPIPSGSNFLYLGQGFVGYVPVVAVIAAVVLIALELYWRRTRAGLRLRAYGNNVDAATMRGVHPRKTLILALGLSGTMSGLAGVLIASYGSGSTARDGSLDLLVTALAAAFLGSAMTRDFLFDPLTAGIASVFVTAVGAGLIANGVSDQWLDGVQGALLLISVVLAVVRIRRLGQVAIF